MLHDYYAFRRVELDSSLKAIAQAADAFEETRQQRDKGARQQAESQMKQVSKNTVQIESHLAYLWFWAKREEADRLGDEVAKKQFSEIANAIRDAWQSSLKAEAIPGEFHSVPDAVAISNMPPLSFILHIPFRLQKPYLSKDERDFYLLDNPLRREKVFQTPMVAATSWKGALRAALWQLDYKEDNKVTIRLLGNPRGSDEHQAGRLYFYPTFFDQIDLEVINPHNRQTGVGARGPILIECVPQKTAGEFVLLYVPFGPIGQNEDERRAEVAEDLQVLAKGIQDMLTTYGFGAKTSSGFGTAEGRLSGEGKLVIRAKLTDGASTDADQPEPQTPNLPRYLESPTQLIPDLRREDRTLKSEEEYRFWVEGQGKKYKKKDQQLYEKAQKWWEEKGRMHWRDTEPSLEPALEQEQPEPPAVSEYTFNSLNELKDLAQRVASQLQEGGGR